MKRFLASLSTISLVETIGRHPAIAGILMLLGVGGGATAIAILTPPTIVPFSSSNFNPNQAIGTTNNGLKPNGGTNGALELPIGPSTGATGSFGLYFEAQVDPALAYGNGASQTPFTGLTLLTNTSSGQPSFIVQRLVGGATGTQWWETPHVGGTQNLNAAAGSNYITGFYPFSATGEAVRASQPASCRAGPPRSRSSIPVLAARLPHSSMRRLFPTSARNRRGSRPRARRAQSLAKCLSPRVFRCRLAFRRG